MRFKLACVILSCLPTLLHAGAPLFKIEPALGETAFPSHIGWYDPPTTRFMSITNQSGATMPVTYTLPPQYSVDSMHSTCSGTLIQGASCQLAVVFNPSKQGHFTGSLQVCGHNGLWCSVDPNGFDITVTNTDIISTQCSSIRSRPFAALDCAGSYTYAQNLYALLANTLHVKESLPLQHFNYFQHTPSLNETITPCLEANQKGVNLDPAITGGGGPLCSLMAYATGNSAANPKISKLFPPYLTALVGTAYPILPSTVVLGKLPALLASFGQSAMDPLVRDLGYNGYVDFLDSYYLQQILTPYAHCGVSAVCPSLFYLPYASSEAMLQTWPPQGIRYWGMSGGGGSGAGYQIEAFKPGNTRHYMLFSGGGGGGGGNTVPEGLGTPNISLINTGSGGGGGSQFANCVVSADGNLSGLGLGAGIGSGLSALEGYDITYQAPPATTYSYYPPTAHPEWTPDVTLASYGRNLTYLFNTLIPQLYNEGYTIAVTGGGGGGAGLEFLNRLGVEYQPQPVSIGYGFNFCYVFNKAQQHSPTDCVSSPNAGSKGAAFLDSLIYKNIGTFFEQGMALAVKSCSGGYSNYPCTCSFQHTYVMCELTHLLAVNGFTSADIPTWMINPHCNETSATMMYHATFIDQLATSSVPSQCAKAVQDFYQVKTRTACVPPWPHG